MFPGFFSPENMSIGQLPLSEWVNVCAWWPDDSDVPILRCILVLLPEFWTHYDNDQDKAVTEDE